MPLPRFDVIFKPATAVLARKLHITYHKAYRLIELGLENDLDKYVSVPKAAYLKGVHPSTIYAHIRKGNQKSIVADDGQIMIKTRTVLHTRWRWS